MAPTAQSNARTPDPIRVAVLNDHELVVEGVAAMLRRYPDRVCLQDVGTDAEPGQAVEVVLYDMFGAAANGRPWSDFLGAGWSPRWVVQYDWNDQPAMSGADGVGVVRVSKSLSGEALVAAIEEIVATGGYSGPAPGAADDEPSAEGGRSRQWPGKAEGLTERESEVVVLIVEGLSNKEIAAALFLGVNTIKTYIRSAYRTMGVTDRSHAILWGIDHGMRLDRA